MTATDLRILMVEDHEEHHDLLGTICRRHSIPCTIVHHQSAAGLAAVQAAGRDPATPDLVILDLDLPRLAGAAIIQAIRADAGLRATIIIVLSGSMEPEDRVACAAADRFLIRPRSFDGWINIALFMSSYAKRKERNASGSPASPAPATAASAPLRAHLLHVDDEADDRALFARAFAKSGVQGVLHQVDSVAAALLFLNRLAPYQLAERPALIVLDLGLPHVDGRELLRILRGNTRFNQIPIIVLTGSESYADMERCRDLLVADYVIKPKTLQELNEFIASLRRWLAETSQQSPQRCDRD
jgi:CheY-like chemotaxis protein